MLALARAFGKSADSLGGANECRALLTELYPGSGRSLAASCPSCPCEMWKINRLEGADGSKRTHTRAHARTHTHTHSLWSSAHTLVQVRTDSQNRCHSNECSHSSALLAPLGCHIMRASARPSHEASAEMIQGSLLGRHSISQVELHTRMAAQLQHSTHCCLQMWKWVCVHQSEQQGICRF